MRVLIIFLASVNAWAVETNVVFTKSVSAIPAETAVLSAAGGETVYKCQPVEMKISKSGTSVSLRNIKKKITKEEAEQKIKEIEKQRDQ